MAKTITETFSLKRSGFTNGEMCKIIASSSGKHYVNVLGGGGELTISEIEDIVKFLAESANKIKSDEDFKTKK